MKKTKEQISYNMSRVKNKDSEIEKKLRAELWRRGFRYQKNSKKIFGKPDIVFIGKKIAVFCDSNFWHGYEWENRKQDIKSNREFWIEKIEKNIERDKAVTQFLTKNEWTVLRFWGHEIKKDLLKCADTVEKHLRGYNV